MPEVEFTEEELSQLEGRDMEPDEAPVHPGIQELEPEPVPESEEAPTEEAPKEEVAAPTVEVEETEEDTTDYKAEFEKQQKANAGLLNALVTTRKAGQGDKEWRRGVEERMELLHGKFEEAEEPADEEPDQDTNPVEWLAWDQKQKIEAAMEPVRAKEQEDLEKEQYAQVLSEAGRLATQAEEELISKTEITREDYNTQLDELRFDRIKWYEASGVVVTDAIKIVEEEERQFVLNSLNSGLNPAAEIVRMHAAVKPRSIPGTEKPAEKPVAAVSKVTTAKQSVQEGGLQNVGGSGSSGGTITAEQLAEMDPDDPIAKKIFSSEKLYADINIYGQVSL